MQETTFIIDGASVHDGGNCWIADLPCNCPEGQTPTTIFPASYELMLYEDGNPLGPSRSAHVDIRRDGGGRFSHWGRSLYFSASDSTDPNKNGRVYSVKVKASPARAEFIAE